MRARSIRRWAGLCLGLGLGHLMAAPGLAASGAEQVIRLPDVGVKLTNDPPFILSAIASSGLPLRYESVAGTNVAAVSGATLTLSGRKGVATIRVSQEGDPNDSPAPAFLSVAVVGSDQVFRQVATGQYHTAAISGNGMLWSWGDNGSGQLGYGGYSSTNRLVQVTDQVDWQIVTAGLEHTLAIKANGTLWAWGGNPYGQLGLGHQVGVDRPAQVGAAADWASVSAAFAHTMAVKRNGTLWAWGDNGIGQLGNGALYLLTNRPAQVGAASDWAMAAGGDAHSLAVKRDGSLWAWGANVSGELGLGVTFTFTNRPARVDSATDWAYVAAGESHSLGLKRDGTLWAWGRNSGGQLGLGTTFTRTNRPVRVGLDADWKSVAAGLGHSMGVKSNGTLWAWGANGAGQLGNGASGGSSSGTNRPGQIGSSTNWVMAVGGTEHTAAFQRDGTLWTWGSAERLGYRPRGLSPALAEWGNAARIAAGASHWAVVKRDGTLWSWGANNWGQLGSGHSVFGTNHPVQMDGETNWMAVAAGDGHSLGVRSNGTLWAWGLNFSGQLGLGRTDEGTNRPTRVGGDDDWEDVAANDAHSMGLKRDGTLLTWGANSDGELGHGNDYFRTNRPTQVGAVGNWQMVAAGNQHMVALKRDGSLWAWGRNAWGQIGNGSNLATNRPVPVAGFSDWQLVAAGGEHSAGIRSNGTLWTWGLNTSGQLGHGTYGAGTNRPVQVGSDHDWQSVAAGSGSTLALKRDGTLWAWGWNMDSLAGGWNSNTNRPVQIGKSDAWRGLAAAGPQALILTADGTPWHSGSLRNSRRPERVLPHWVPQSMTPVTIAPVRGQGRFQLRSGPSSGLPARYGVDGPATMAEDQLSVFGSGRVTISAYQEGDDHWDAAEPVGSEARFLVAGQRIPDSLTGADPPDPTRPEAMYFAKSYWLVTPPENVDGEVALFARNSINGLHPLLRVYDFETGSLIAAGTAMDGQAMAVFARQAGATYRATVSTTEPGQAGGFAVALYPVAHPGDSMQGTLELKDRFSLTRAAAVGAGRWIYDDYLLRGVAAGDRVEIAVDGEVFAPFLEIRLLADESVQDYRDGASYTLTVQGTAQGARDYLIRVTTSASGALGGYTLRVDRVEAAPEIWSFSPGSGVPGTKVLLRGTNFLDGLNPVVTGVEFGGAPANWDDPVATGSWQEFMAEVPLAGVSGPIRVLTAGTAGVSTTAFIVLSPVGDVRRETGGGFSFAISNAVAGIQNVVERAETLTAPVAWTPVTTNVADSGGWRFTNAAPGAGSQQFFRVRRP